MISLGEGDVPWERKYTGVLVMLSGDWGCRSGSVTPSTDRERMMRGFIDKSKGIALNGSIYCFTNKARATPRSSTSSQERNKGMDETEIYLV